MTGNIAASIRHRLLNFSKEHGEEFQLTLTRYALQRFVVRLIESQHRDRFVLKGATLFTLWTDEKYRATRDLDLLGFGESRIQEMERIFKEICVITSTEDGLVFQADSVKGETIRDAEEYQGVRITTQASLEQARIPIQVDIGFGDAITPAANLINYPNILGLSSASILCYPRETVVAEKFQAMTKLGMANSRLKDFYDIWFLAMSFSFSGTELAKAIENTFTRRQTKVPRAVPIALTEEFSEDSAKKAQWRAFLTKAKATVAPGTLPSVVEIIASFLMPPAVSVASKESFEMKWAAGGPWK